MADNNQNLTSSNPANNSKKTPASPWEEELPPEEPQKPQLVGSLDPTMTEKDSELDKKPVPFNIPTNIAEEKVGKKIPANEVLNKESQIAPAQISQLPPVPKQNIEEPKLPPIPKQNVEEPKLAPVPKQNIEEPKLAPVPPVPKQNVEEPKLAPVPPIPKQNVEEPKLPPKEEQPKGGITELIKPDIPKVPLSNEPKKVLPKTAPTPAKTSIFSRMNPFGRHPAESKKPENKKPVLPDIKTNKIESGSVSNKVLREEPQIAPAQISQLPPVPKQNIEEPKLAPVPKQNVEEPKLPPKEEQPKGGITELIKPDIPKVPSSNEPKKVLPKTAPTPAKTSIFSRMNPFGRHPAESKKPENKKPVLPDIKTNKIEPDTSSNQNQTEVDKSMDNISKTPITPMPPPAINKFEYPDIFAPTESNIPVQNQANNEKQIPTPIKKPVDSGKPSFFKRPGFVITATIVLLLTIGTYLTEVGLISVGFEKVYGIFGLENLWGGLSRNPEKALGQSALAMKDQLNFKINGNVTLTVNKTIKSPIITPLVSIANSPYAARDENVSGMVKAILTQYDYYSSDSTSNNSSTNSSTDTSTGSSSSSSSTTSQNSSTSGFVDQSQSSSYQPEETTIKQIEATFDGISSNDAIKTDIKIKKLVGSDSTVSMIFNKNDLYLKSSSDIKYASNADSSKWLDYKLSSISENNPIGDFTNIKMDQGLSIIGRRSGNEKVGSIRCFKYTLDNFEIGDSLDYLGLNSDNLSKISGDVWIGVADHYIHKVDLKITPSIASSISQISVTFELSEYGVENSILIPALNDKIVAATDGTTISTTATTSANQDDMYSRDKIRKSDLVIIKDALEKYKASNGSYPVAKNIAKLNVKDNIIQTSLVAEFITIIPSDPKTAEGWYYGYRSDGIKFTLSARLENSADPQVTRVGEAYIHWVYNN